MPETFRVAAKFWIGLAGAIATAVVAVLGPDSPRWLTVAVAVLTAIGVYLVPNTEPLPPLGDLPDEHQG